jgi:hemoglobin-like flavoprotein
MNATQTHLVRKSFAAVERQADVAALVFYRRLFELAPGLRPMFKSDIQEQAKKLMEMLAVALNLLERPAELAGELEDLGARHLGYGTRPEHYATVRQALVDMFVDVMGDGFSSEMRQAWGELYEFIEAAMLRGAAVAQENAARSPSLPRAPRPSS